MSVFGAMIAANQLLRRELAALDRPFPKRAPSLSRLPAEPPPSFACHEDPRERFTLSYPGDWILTKRNGVHAASPRIGTFVHVEVLADTLDPWAFLVEDAKASGAVLDGLRTREDRASGTLVAGDYRFEWEARRFPRGSERIILATGNVADAKRSRAIERYEDVVLAAIRRYFRVSAIS